MIDIVKKRKTEIITKTNTISLKVQKTIINIFLSLINISLLLTENL